MRKDGQAYSHTLKKEGRKDAAKKKTSHCFEERWVFSREIREFFSSKLQFDMGTCKMPDKEGLFFQFQPNFISDTILVG